MSLDTDSTHIARCVTCAAKAMLAVVPNPELEQLTAQLSKYDGLLDDKYGVEMTKPRRKFHLHPVWQDPKPISSLITVAETYGVPVATAFVRYLELTVASHAQVSNYVVDSMFQLGLMEQAHQTRGLLERCSCLFTHLLSDVPILNIAPVELSLELLAKIVDSTRVSRDLRRLVLIQRRQAPITECELWSAAKKTGVELVQVSKTKNSVVYSHYPYNGWDMSKSIWHGALNIDPTWSFTLGMGEIGVHGQTVTGPHRHYSLHCYLTALETRGCLDIKERMGQLLDLILTYEDERACAWIAQLSLDIGDGTDRRYESREEMRAELARLVEKARVLLIRA